MGLFSPSGIAVGVAVGAVGVLVLGVLVQIVMMPLPDVKLRGCGDAVRLRGLGRRVRGLGRTYSQPCTCNCWAPVEQVNAA